MCKIIDLAKVRFIKNNSFGCRPITLQLRPHEDAYIFSAQAAEDLVGALITEVGGENLTAVAHAILFAVAERFGEREAIEALEHAAIIAPGRS